MIPATIGRTEKEVLWWGFVSFKRATYVLYSRLSYKLKLRKKVVGGKVIVTVSGVQDDSLSASSGAASKAIKAMVQKKVRTSLFTYGIITNYNYS